MKSMRLVTSTQSSVIHDAVGARNDSRFTEVQASLAIRIFPGTAYWYASLQLFGMVSMDSGKYLDNFLEALSGPIKLSINLLFELC